jgi:adenylate kinase
MMTIEHVTREINRILAAIGAVEPHAPKVAKAAKKAMGSRSKPAATAANTAKGPANAVRKAAKVVARGAKRLVQKMAIAKRGKSPKKVTKKRAKR